MMTEEARLQRMLAYHQRQVDRITDALLLLDEDEKTAKKAERLTRKVQAQVGGVRIRPAISAKSYVERHGDLKAEKPSIEIRRLVAQAAAEGLSYNQPAVSSAYFAARKAAQLGITPWEIRKRGRPGKPGRPKKQAAPAMSKSQRLRLRTMSGDTVTNRVRRVLQEHGSGALTRADIQEQAKVSELVEARHAAASTAKALEAMARNKEVKQTKDGWVAYKLQPPTPPATDNGARA